jgi:hypothetical protein
VWIWGPPYCERHWSLNNQIAELFNSKKARSDSDANRADELTKN